MKSLTANLKTLYQCRRIWIFHLILISGFITMGISSYILGAEFPFFAFPLIFITLYGEGIAMIAGEVLSRPYGFCLPGHTKTVQKFILLIWLSIMTIFFLIIATLYVNGCKTSYAIFIGYIGLFNLSYWMGITIIIKRWIIFPFLAFLGLSFTTFFMPELIDIRTVLMAHPWFLTFLSGVISYMIYRAVGRRENVRRLCAKPGIGFGAFSAEAQARFKRERMRMMQYKKPDRASESAGDFFSGRIRSNHHLTLLANLWGQVYLVIGPIASSWRAILLGIVLFSLCLCLLQQVKGQGLFMFLLMIFIAASVMISIIFQYHRFDISLLIGRKEYFWRRIFLLFTIIFISLGIMASSFLLFNLLSGFLLPITFEKKSFSPAINWILLIVPVLMIPLFGGIFILFRKTILMISIIIMLIIVMVASCSMVVAMENAPLLIGLIIILSAAVITWGYFITMLYYDSMKRSLC